MILYPLKVLLALSTLITVPVVLMHITVVALHDLAQAKRAGR